MNILILNPMTSKTKNVVRDVVYGCWCKGKRIGGATVPPYNLLVLTSLLKRHSLNTDFIDAQAEQLTPDVIRSRIDGYDLVVMSTSTMTFNEDADYLLELKSINNKLVTVIFGSHPTFMPDYCLAHPGIDIVIKHEPELVLLEFIKRLKSAKSYHNLKGIGFKKVNGEHIINESFPFIKNLDILPFPDIKLLPKGIDYFNPIIRRLPYITTSTSRGCPGKCTFCTAPNFDGSVLRFQSAEYVIKEIEYFISNGIKEIYFRDDTFFINKQRDHAIFNHIIKNNLDITWVANARINMIDEETLRLAAKAGCHTIKFGIESGVQEILDGMRKGYKLEQAREVFLWAEKAKIKTHAHVMIGNPGDNVTSIKKTIKFVINLNPATATFGICTPYPGTPLFEQVKSVYPEIRDGSASDLSKLHVEGLFNEHFTSLKSSQLSKLVVYAYKKFYMRPFFWIRSVKLHIKNVEDLKRVTIAASNLFNFILRGKD